MEMSGNAINYRVIHNKKIEKFVLGVFAALIPFDLVLAYVYESSLLVALVGSLAVFGSSFLAYRVGGHKRMSVYLAGFNIGMSSALIIYAMRGIPEAHYFLFSLVSMSMAFASVRVVVVTVLTVAVHHLGTYFLLPQLAFPTADYPFELLVIHVIAAVIQGLVLGGLAHFLAKMVNTQGVLVVDMTTASSKADDTSQFLEGLSVKLSDSSHRQESSIQTTAATLTEMAELLQTASDQVGSSAHQMSDAFESMKETSRTLKDATVSIADVEDGSRRIMSSVEENARRFEDVVRLIGEIDDKTKMINDIVFQTKLLSFNASVEAARAGEAGKGFSVVAAEIGQLAISSGQAAVEINQILSESTSTVEKVADDLRDTIQQLAQESVTKTKQSADMVEDSNQRVSRVFEQIAELTKVLDQLASSSKENSLGIKTIQESLVEIEAAASSNSGFASETASKITDLRKISKEIKELVDVVCDKEAEGQGALAELASAAKKNSAKKGAGRAA